MHVQIITTPNGERLAIMPEAEYNALREALEDQQDATAVRDFRAALAAGEEELIPADYVNRILDGESPVRVWREYRGLSAKELADIAGTSTAYLSQIETGKREGTLETMRRLAKALNVTIDDLAG